MTYYLRVVFKESGNVKFTSFKTIPGILEAYNAAVDNPFISDVRILKDYTEYYDDLDNTLVR